MRLHQLALVASLAMSVPAALAAQTTSTASTSTNGAATTTTTTTTTTDTSGAQTSSTQPYTTADTTSEHLPSRWMASGSIGTNYSNNSAAQPGGIASSSAISAIGGVASDTSGDQSLNVGLAVGYLWHSIAGAEFMADFTPDFNLANTFVASDASPALNAYMVNAIGAVPLGADARFQPYVSGGFGGMTLRGATVASGLTPIGPSISTGGNAVNDVFNPDESHGAGNIGFGLMAFMANWGVRGDLRYFRAFGSSTDNLSTASASSSTGTVVTGLLPGLDFWRANIGVAFRW